jgi:hypothetical protein
MFRRKRFKRPLTSIWGKRPFVGRWLERLTPGLNPGDFYVANPEQIPKAMLGAQC